MVTTAQRRADGALEVTRHGAAKKAADPYADLTDAPPKRGRGRPRKYATPEEAKAAAKARRAAVKAAGGPVAPAEPRRKNSRAKGAAGERELAQRLRELWGFEAKRGVQYQGSADSPDVVGWPGVHIECKRVEALNINEAYAQALRDAGNTRTPVVAHRRNNRPWLLTLDLEHAEAFAIGLLAAIRDVREHPPTPPQTLDDLV